MQTVHQPVVDLTNGLTAELFRGSKWFINHTALVQNLWAFFEKDAWDVSIYVDVSGPLRWDVLMKALENIAVVSQAVNPSVWLALNVFDVNVARIERTDPVNLLRRVKNDTLRLPSGSGTLLQPVLDDIRIGESVKHIVISDGYFADRDAAALDPKTTLWLKV